MQAVVEACLRRWDPASDQARRLFHGRGHCYPGYEHLVVNWFPPYLLVQDYGHSSTAERHKLVAGLRDAITHATGIAVQARDGRRTQTEVVYGDVPEEHVVHEGDLRYLIKPQRNQNVGLFMDMAHVRRYLADRVAGAAVLNLFAYTCAFSVSALHYGAKRVVNVDMSRNALEWGARNHELNGQDPRQVSMIPHNVFKSWWKLKQLGPYGVIVIDPPTNQRGSFNAEKSYGQVLKRLDGLAHPGTVVMACLNSPFLGPEFLHEQMSRWCARCEFVEQLPLHADFPDRFPERGLKVLAFTYR